MAKSKESTASSANHGEESASKVADVKKRDVMDWIITMTN